MWKEDDDEQCEIDTEMKPPLPPPGSTVDVDAGGGNKHTASRSDNGMAQRRKKVGHLRDGSEKEEGRQQYAILLRNQYH